MQKYTAIILSSREANEFDRLYSMYTLETGLIKAIGKGVRKSTAKLAGHLEPATLSEVYVARARGTGQITSVITLSGFENLKIDFEKLGEVLKIFRFFSKNFAEGEKDERIFDLLRSFLELADRADIADRADPADILIEAFWWKLFDALGQRPEVMKCVNCREKLRGQSSVHKVRTSNQGSTFPLLADAHNSSRSNLKKYFSVEKGGIVCGGCGSNFAELAPISDNQIKLLRIFWGNPLAKIAKVKVNCGELEGLGRIRENFEKYSF